MQQTKYKIPTLKETPKDADNVSSALLLRGGFIDKLSSGVYTFLPLGLKVLKKIENIVREEMNNIGAQEILMPALHIKEYWEKTDRWQIDVMFKTKSKTGQEYGLGWTHEEIITPLAKRFINSYRDLPLYLYQIQTKFRDELRAKSGLLRTREFSMKDLYSFHTDESNLDKYYEKVKNAYFKIYKRLGIGEKTVLAYASGGAFSKYSHEFQTITESGEDEIYLCKKCNIAINKEIIKENPFCPECKKKDFEIKKAIEVGNIFKLGTRFSKAFNLTYLDKEGKQKEVIMGCYGLGPTRTMGAIVEVMHDEKGIIWPQEIAPFMVHLLFLGKDQKVKKQADKIYLDLQKKGIEALYDDREESAGVKFTEADLIGIPYRVVVSERTLAKDSVGIKRRNKKDEILVKIKDLINRLEE